MIIDYMNQRELDNVHNEVNSICSSGKIVTFVKPETTNELGEIISPEETLDLNSFPIKFTPFDTPTLERIKWTKDVDVICYFSKKAVDDLPKTKDELKEHRYILIDSKRFDIIRIEYYANYGDDFLYYVIGACEKVHYDRV